LGGKRGESIKGRLATVQLPQPAKRLLSISVVRSRREWTPMPEGAFSQSRRLLGVVEFAEVVEFVR
jgi:hypothetical protein